MLSICSHIKLKKPGEFQNPMYESVHETCSQTNGISLHVKPTPVELWHGQQPLNQTDKAIHFILNCDSIQILTYLQSVDIETYCTLKEVKSNDVIIL